MFEDIDSFSPLQKLQSLVAVAKMVNGVEWQERDTNWYMVECLDKKAKLLVQASSAPEEGNHIHYLPDELVVEILCRLPCSKSAIQCKCVCKRWTALISHLYFIRRFIACKVEDRVPCIENAASNSKSRIRVDGSHYESNTSRFDRTNKEMEMAEQPFAIVARLQNCHKYNTWEGLMMHLRDPVVNLHDISVSSLPYSVDGNATPLTVVGACNDLLLYRRDELDKYDYYMCNVQTRQWLMLPSPLFYHGKYALTGFTCDPYYSYEGGNPRCNVILNAAYRYSIVVVPYTNNYASEFSAHLFMSDTGQWTEIVLSLPGLHFLVPDYCGFVFAGNVHLCCAKGMFCFDPYQGATSADGVIQCHLIWWPPRFPGGYACTGVCQGRLRLYKVTCNGRISIWVLKDYKTSEWSLQHSIVTQEWVPRDNCLSSYRDKHGRLGCVLGEHPTDPNIIYLLGPRGILLCNASTRTLEVVSCLSTSFMRSYTSFKKFPLMFPIWPTPIPTLV